LKRKLLVPEFIEVKNIDKNDFIGFPIPKYEKDIKQYTEDDCRFYGILLGDGNISSVNNLAYVSLNKETKKETIEFVENYLTKLNIHITYTYVNDKYVRLTWTRNNMFKFTYEMLYDSNKEKYVLSNMLHLPKEKISLYLFYIYIFNWACSPSLALSGYYLNQVDLGVRPTVS
jgi:ribonucleoside-diphosphate reductase alpha chain